jgi:succinoglycan biosynthesis transport protein ExoP
MTQDERLIPARPGRDLNTTLTEIAQTKAYEKYGKYGPPSENHLRDYLFVVLKRKWLILSLVLIVTPLVTIQMFRTPSIYEGETIIRIEPKTESVLRSKELVITQADPNFWGTQLKLLENPVLAREVVLTLDLMHNSAFLNPQNQPGVFSALRRMFSRDKEQTKSRQDESAEPTLVTDSNIREQQLTPEELAQLESYEDAIIGNETVDTVPGTNLVSIKFQHSDPRLALQISNTLAEVFVNNNLARRTAGSTRAQDLLAKEIADLQTKIKHDQEAQFNYAKSHNLPMTSEPTSNIEWQRLLQLGVQLVEAEKDRKLAQGIYEHARDSGDPAFIPEIIKNAHISNLQYALAGVKQKRDSLLTMYTPEWPEVKKLEAEIKRLETELANAIAANIAGLKVEYEAKLAQENSIRQAYAAQRGITTQQAGDQLEMVEMSQELETNKQYLNTLLQRLRELEAISGDRSNELSIENPGRVPKSTVGPPRMRNIMIAFLLSLVAGIGLAFLLDFLDDTVKSVDDVDRYLHLPALALIPASRNETPRLKGIVPTSTGPSSASALALVEDVRSPVAESYRHLRTSLLLSSAGQPPKTILITSSQPSEGKTTTAANTAFILAKTGAEVLIIDCDLRRPRLHTNFELPNTRGLTNWLSGETDLDSLIQSYGKQPNLKLLTSGPVPPNPAELLGSEQMRKLLGILRERFAHILIDSPPAISFTDASILATMVDGVVLVVHGGRSSRAVVRRAKQQLLDVGANIFGIVLNNVKIEPHDYYSGYYSAYYGSQYYGEADDANTDQSAGATSA